MPDFHTLLLFSAAVLGLMVTPGPSMAFLFAHSMVSGPKGGLAVATGIFLSDLVMSALTAAGITAVVLALPGSLDLIRAAGAGYLLWLAYRALRSGATVGRKFVSKAPFAAVVRQAAINSLLNPKAFLFFVVFIPQFVVPARGNLAIQMATLGIVLSLEALVFHASLGLVSSSLAPRMTEANAEKWLTRLQALVFLVLALRLVALESPAG